MTTRPMMSISTDPAMDVQVEPMAKTQAVPTMEMRRPRISTILPLTNAPKMQPSSTALTTHSCM